jgi:hypothetical protein
MTLSYAKHEKVSLRKHQTFNEKWLQDRIAEDPSILGFGDVRLLDRERHTQGGGRLDLLLIDDDAGRRYEVELQLGDTDPSHIIRCIEYWDAEKRRYPGYEHVAVLIAENVTSRFLNVVSLMAGSIPMLAIQLDALSVEDNLILNFTQILDQTELRVDDTDEDAGGGQVDRDYWQNKVGKDLLKFCDQTLNIINETASVQRELNYLRGYIGLQANGISNNFIYMMPKRTKKITHLMFRNSKSKEWTERFVEAGIPAVSNRKGRFRATITPDEFSQHEILIREAITETVQEYAS